MRIDQAACAHFLRRGLCRPHLDTLKLHAKGRLSTLAPETLNKLYVALSRSRGDVHLVPQTLLERYKAPRASGAADVASKDF
jgi:hypothetical protein